MNINISINRFFNFRSILIVLLIVVLADSEICDCPLYLRPLCASNGGTFVNDCELECYKKGSGLELEVVERWVCPDFKGNYLQNEQWTNVWSLPSDWRKIQPFKRPVSKPANG